MSSNVCGVISVIDNDIVFDQNSQNYTLKGQLINNYCPNSNCDNDNLKVSSAFITLVTLLNGIDDKENLGSDKFAEYAILWLSYILNQNPQNGTTTLNDFYTNHIETHANYNQKIPDDNDTKINKDVINKKKELMKMNINIISSFYDEFKSLCNMYSELDANNNQCKKCFDNAGEFFERYEKLNNVLDIAEGSSYSQILSSLSNDYNKFKEKYNKLGCNNSSPLVACPRSSVTKNTLITIAITFVAASILLGVSYKVNNELKIFFHYIYANINIKIIRFLTFYISIRYLDFGNDLKNNI
ncbi:putative yir4 protein [Plasmodium yoelii yoelii]|uniref:Yir4 protein n=1 Tax=Plasmodium yoelii yoelii TaxID=73239 RepID=Q7R8E2_PLAYO|nr:putative yir4 protein [Plasmodium yoelii yoelii]